jgi:hypothetical protein
MIQCIEKITGNLKLNQYTLFLNGIEDMDELEYWEARFEKFNEPHAVTYYLKNGKIYYNLYCNVHKGGSAFRV